MRFTPLFALLWTGCLAHHPLLDELPPSGAPLIERAEAYERVKPSPLVGPNPALPGVTLASGVLINDPMELAPLVAEDSNTMQHAKAARDLGELSGWIGAAGITVGLLGITGEIVGGVLAYSTGDPIGTDAGLTIAVSSAIVGITGLLAASAPFIYFGFAAADEREVAFATYDSDLRARLALVPRVIQ